MKSKDEDIVFPPYTPQAEASLVFPPYTEKENLVFPSYVPKTEKQDTSEFKWPSLLDPITIGLPSLFGGKKALTGSATLIDSLNPLPIATGAAGAGNAAIKLALSDEKQTDIDKKLGGAFAEGSSYGTVTKYLTDAGIIEPYSKDATWQDKNLQQLAGEAIGDIFHGIGSGVRYGANKVIGANEATLNLINPDIKIPRFEEGTLSDTLLTIGGTVGLIKGGTAAGKAGLGAIKNTVKAADVSQNPFTTGETAKPTTKATPVDTPSQYATPNEYIKAFPDENISQVYLNLRKEHDANPTAESFSVLQHLRDEMKTRAEDKAGVVRDQPSQVEAGLKLAIDERITKLETDKKALLDWHEEAGGYLAPAEVVAKRAEVQASLDKIEKSRVLLEDINEARTVGKDIKYYTEQQKQYDKAVNVSDLLESQKMPYEHADKLTALKARYEELTTKRKEAVINLKNDLIALSTDSLGKEYTDGSNYKSQYTLREVERITDQIKTLQESQHLLDSEYISPAYEHPVLNASLHAGKDKALSGQYTIREAVNTFAKLSNPVQSSIIGTYNRIKFKSNSPMVNFIIDQAENYSRIGKAITHNLIGKDGLKVSESLSNKERLELAQGMQKGFGKMTEAMREEKRQYYNREELASELGITDARIQDAFLESARIHERGFSVYNEYQAKNGKPAARPMSNYFHRDTIGKVEVKFKFAGEENFMSFPFNTRGEAARFAEKLYKTKTLDGKEVTDISYKKRSVNNKGSGVTASQELVQALDNARSHHDLAAKFPTAMQTLTTWADSVRSAQFGPGKKSNVHSNYVGKNIVELDKIPGFWKYNDYTAAINNVRQFTGASRHYSELLGRHIAYSEGLKGKAEFRESMLINGLDAKERTNFRSDFVYEKAQNFEKFFNDEVNRNTSTSPLTDRNTFSSDGVLTKINDFATTWSDFSSIPGHVKTPAALETSMLNALRVVPWVFRNIKLNGLLNFPFLVLNRYQPILGFHDSFAIAAEAAGSNKHGFKVGEYTANLLNALHSSLSLFPGFDPVVKKAGLSRVSLLESLKEDPSFQKAFARAKQDSVIAEANVKESYNLAPSENVVGKFHEKVQSKLSDFAEVHPAEVTFGLAWKLAKRQGMSDSKAYYWAKDQTTKVMADYNAASIPEWARTLPPEIAVVVRPVLAFTLGAASNMMNMGTRAKRVVVGGNNVVRSTEAAIIAATLTTGLMLKGLNAISFSGDYDNLIKWSRKQFPKTDLGLPTLDEIKQMVFLASKGAVTPDMLAGGTGMASRALGMDSDDLSRPAGTPGIAVAGTIGNIYNLAEQTAKSTAGLVTGEPYNKSSDLVDAAIDLLPGPTKNIATHYTSSRPIDSKDGNIGYSARTDKYTNGFEKNLNLGLIPNPAVIALNRANNTAMGLNSVQTNLAKKSENAIIDILARKAAAKLRAGEEISPSFFNLGSHINDRYLNKLAETYIKNNPAGKDNFSDHFMQATLLKLLPQDQKKALGGNLNNTDILKAINFKNAHDAFVGNKK